MSLQCHPRVAVAVGGVTMTGSFGCDLPQRISKMSGYCALLGLQQGIQYAEIPRAEGGW